MGLALADVNGDGYLDVFTTAIDGPSAACGGRPCPDYYGGNRLFLNQGDRTFLEMADDYQVRDGHWGWGAAALEIDNDGRVDLVMTNGVDYGMSEEARDWGRGFALTPKRLWLSRDEAFFDDVAASAGLDVRKPGTGLAVADLFADGRPAIIMVHPGSTPTVWRNITKTNNAWLRVRVTGRGGPDGSNTEGLGAVVEVTARPGGPTHAAEVGANSHFLGQSERVVHVGLGDEQTLAAGVVYQVQVRFPATGRLVTLVGVSPNQVITVAEPAE
jgi:hypothetical protein